MPSYVVAVEGLDVQLEDFREAPDKIKLAVTRALNRTADRARTRSDRSIRKQVAFSASYLRPSTGRLVVSKRARRNDLETEITGRFRPTSLARFVQGRPRRGQPVRLNVKPGRVATIPRAFVIPLRAGTADIETKANLGLAIRLRPGERIENKRRFKRLSNGLYLLFGPSVDQVFRSVGADEAEPSADYFETEFARLLDL